MTESSPKFFLLVQSVTILAFYYLRTQFQISMFNYFTKPLVGQSAADQIKSKDAENYSSMLTLSDL